mgnify:CR=1 FL=1
MTIGPASTRWIVDHTVVSVGPYMFHSAATRGRSCAARSGGNASPPHRAVSAGLPRHPVPPLWSLREFVGLLFVLFYASALPPLLAKMWFKAYYEKLGTSRYYVSVVLFLMMMSLPIKMLARWLFNLKYILHIQEIFFNI